MSIIIGYCGITSAYTRKAAAAGIQLALKKSAEKRIDPLFPASIKMKEIL